MSPVFRIHVLPAQRGDALWVEYGTEARLRHVLVDGGITATGRTHLRERIEAVGTPLHIELLVVTHIDLDHILGVLDLLQDLPEGVTFGEIWFNGWDQIKTMEHFGLAEGLALARILKERYADIWNKAAGGRAIALDAQGQVVRVPPLAGGMAVTVLGPAHAQLASLRDTWETVVEEFGAQEEAEAQGVEPLADNGPPGLEAFGAIDVQELAESSFSEDRTVPNGSSIALMLEFGGKKALLLGDAYPSVVTGSLRPLASEGRLGVDVVKVSPHGSRSTTSRDFALALRAPTWIFSSNGANNTKHPHPEAVARVLHDGAGVRSLVFNYRTRFNEMWNDDTLKEEHGYDTVYGDGRQPVTVTLL